MCSIVDIYEGSVSADACLCVFVSLCILFSSRKDTTHVHNVRVYIYLSLLAIFMYIKYMY